MKTESDSLLNIALIAQTVDNSTGLGRVASALAMEYVDAGHSVHIVSQSCDSTPGVVHHVPRLAITPSIGKMVFRLFEPSVTGKIAAPIIHAFGVGAEADFVAAQSCHKAAVKLQQNRGKGRISSRNLGSYDRISLQDELRLFTNRRRKRIVAVSHLVRSQIIEEYGLPEDAICVIPNGVHLSRFRREKRTASGDAAQRGPFVFLFVGNEFDRKGLQTVIEALPSLSRHSLEVRVAGNDDPSPYKRKAFELGVIDHLRFLGSVSAPESLFMEADALVFPTHYEPFGMVIIEAMAAGIPVITTRSAGAVEDMTDGVHGVFLEDPCSAEELSKRMSLLLEDRDLRETVSMNGRIAAERYDWSVIAVKHIDLYRSVCE
jgi:glycosyltransferase involved in cell wall biosynthesis